MPFPLPLTPFELYYLLDDRPEYPTTFPLDLWFTGELQHAPFLAALQTALSRHQMLRVLVDKNFVSQSDKKGTPTPHWVLSEQPMPPVDWQADAQPITHVNGEFIDLTQETGLRVWVRVGKNTSRIRLQFHHACCDGLACFQFVEELLVCYNAEVAGQSATVELPPLNNQQLLRRGSLGAEAEGHRPWYIQLRDLGITFKLWTSLLLRRCDLIAKPTQNTAEVEQTTPAFLAFESYALSTSDARKLRQIASAQNATLNDLFLRDMFLTLQAWNQRHANLKTGRFRLNMPVNLRDRDDKQLPVTNRLSFGFVQQRVSENCDRPALLAAVRQETDKIKRYKLGLYFLGGLMAAVSHKPMILWALNRKQSFATLVLSNVGRTFAHAPLSKQGRKLICGNVVLEHVAGVPPVRPLTRAAMAVIEYAEEMQLNLRCDPQFFSESQTRELLAEFVEQLHTTMRLGI